MRIRNWTTPEGGREEGRREILKERGLVSFDVNITPEEKKSIAEVDFQKELPQFNHFGPVNEKLVRSLIVYFNELGRNSDEMVGTISHLVARVTRITLKDFGKDSAWIMVRTSLPNNDFDVPRWHADGKYFDSENKTYKLVMTIKGALTRFGEATDSDKFKKLTEESSRNHDINHDNPEVFVREDLRIRRELDAVIRETNPSKEGEAVYYLVGDEGAKIHSEPKIDAPRIFMSVVVGSNDQINELKERWGEK